MPVRRTPAALAGLLAAALTTVAVSGCSAESAATAPPVEATSTPPVVASPTESPSGPPPMPEEARGTSRKAAVAFVRHWVDILNYSADTLDSAPLRELSSPQCDGCRGALKSIEGVAAGEGTIEDHSWQLADLYALNAVSGVVQVQAVVDVAAMRVRRQANDPWEKFDGGRIIYVFDVDTSPRGTRITRLVGEPA